MPKSLTLLSLFKGMSLMLEKIQSRVMFTMEANNITFINNETQSASIAPVHNNVHII